ncbi:double zinc ribbon domain-containing protein [Massilia sp. SM-13]|uniref:double zinc ribbon domain-containing protein n=1 Tax=Pseudoduganella rhizocola TaxID=3382643 RepID=UPI0038B42144
MATALHAALSRWLGAALPALLPVHCVLCGLASAQHLCAGCREQCLSGGQPRCPVCADPLPGADGTMPCGRCLRHPPDYDATLVAADYVLPVDSLVLQLKFGARLAHARLFGGLLADAALASPGFVKPALLCPVPLGPERLAERGFNQALEIARPLGKRLGIGVDAHCVVRVQDTLAQSLLHARERRRNIAAAFSVTDRAQVEGRHIGVVDDVMSSGETLQELAATLKRYGAARVTNIVFARTPPSN